MEFVKFHKINLFSLSGCGKKTFIKEVKKFNNPAYEENNILYYEQRNNSNNLILEEEIENIKVKLNNENLCLKFYISNLDNIVLLKEKSKYLTYETEIILLLIDITKSQSFDIAKTFLEELIKNNENREKKYEIFIISNKIDLETERNVGSYEINQLIENYSYIKLYEISLLTLENFENLINNINITLKSDSFKQFNKISLMNPIKMNKKFLLEITNTMSIFLLGNSSVGKTSFIKRFFDNYFSTSNLSTLGIDVEKTYVKINDQNIIKIDVWDTAGQERLRSIPRKYYIKGDAFILMYDVTNENSFNDLNQWIKDIKENKGIDNNNNENYVIYLAGNKIDIINERKIQTEDAENFSRENKIKYVEISCKNGINVNEIMENIIYDTSQKLGTFNNFIKIKNIKDDDNKNKKKNNCC